MLAGVTPSGGLELEIARESLLGLGLERKVFMRGVFGSWRLIEDSTGDLRQFGRLVQLVRLLYGDVRCRALVQYEYLLA